MKKPNQGRTSLSVLVDIVADPAANYPAVTVLSPDPQSAIDKVLVEAAKTNPNLILVGAEQGHELFHPLRGAEPHALGKLVSRFARGLATDGSEATGAEGEPALLVAHEIMFCDMYSEMFDRVFNGLTDELGRAPSMFEVMGRIPMRDLWGYGCEVSGGGSRKDGQWMHEATAAGVIAIGERLMANLVSDGDSGGMLPLLACNLEEDFFDRLDLAKGSCVIVNRVAMDDPKAHAMAGAFLRLRALSGLWSAKGPTPAKPSRSVGNVLSEERAQAVVGA